MSRLFGTTRKSASLVDAMEGASKSRPDWLTSRGANEAGTVGVTGWRNLQVFETETLAVAVEGFFYNLSDLPQGGNDAERFAALYREHGVISALEKVNGDFAIALADAQRGELWLGRDRLGVRPLFYVEKEGELSFSSRPRALFPVPGVSRRPDVRFSAVFGASHYRYIDNAPNESPFKDISQLPGGHALRFTKGKSEIHRWWELRDRGDLSDSEETLAEAYRELLLDSVRLRLARAHRPAFTLSGGMDSSSVLASAVKVSGSKQVAISSVYEDKTYDESDDIRSMLEDCVSDWIQVKVGTPEIFDLVGKMVLEHDEPVVTGTWLSHYLLCEETAKRGFGGLFGGLGGDELNAGEYEYFFAFFADLLRDDRRADYEREVASWVKHHDHPVFKKSLAVADETVGRISDPTKPGVLTPDRGRLERYLKALNPEYFDLKAYQPVMEHPFQSALKNRTFQDLTRETAPCCLRAEDRQTIAFGLDNFLPFFDHRLVELMYQVAGTMKIRDGVTKVLLRRAMKGVLPEETRTRIAKTGWNAPGHVWFSGKGGDALRDLVRSRSFRERGIYVVEEVERLIDEHQAIMDSGEPRDNHMMFFWQLVNLELWLRSLDSVPTAA